MEDDINSIWRILLFILILSFSIAFSQEISFVQYPSEVVRGEKFSVRLNLYTNPTDKLYMVALIDEGNVNFVETFVLADSLIKVKPLELKFVFKDSIPRAFLTGKAFVFADTFERSSALRSYVFVMTSTTSRRIGMRFLPLRIADLLMFNLDEAKKGQVSINVKSSAGELAGLCAKFEKDGFIKFNINDKFTAKNGFLLSFWIKTTSMGARIITLKSNIDDNFLSAGVKFGNIFFSISNSIGKYEIDLPRFISDGGWHNIIICASQSDNILKFFIDGEKIDEVYIPNFSLFQLDNPVVIIEQGEVDEIALFSTYKPEMVKRLSRYFAKFDSDVVFLLKFENEKVNVFGNISEVESRGVKFIPSSAPICSPEIKIYAEMRDGNISVSWEVSDPTSVDKFVIERRIGEGDYQQVYQVFSSEQKKYYFLDKVYETNAVYFYRVRRINKDGSFDFSDEVKIGVGLKKDFEIIGNFPNPFNYETRIVYNLFSDTYVKLSVYDITGKEIAVLVDGFQTAGRHEVVFDLSSVKGHEMTSGIYFYKLQTQNTYEIRKMILIK